MKEWHVFEKREPFFTRCLSSTSFQLNLNSLTVSQKYQCSFINLIEAADHSAAALVNLLAADFSCFNDVTRFENRKSVRFLKRAQILCADLWAAFEGEGYGRFDDIDKITIFADYRIPQILNSLGCLWYNPLLESAIQQKQLIQSGHSWEIQLRGNARTHLLPRMKLR